MPDPNTAWEQIIDSRSDEETRLKYLALINWVNEVASSSLACNEISEKYEYLYFQYKKSYEKHKIKSTLGVLEIFAALAISIKTGNASHIQSLTNQFFKIGTYAMDLYNEEGSLPGKEISYVYHPNNEFPS